MPIYTESKEAMEYTYQIAPCNGFVTVEILNRNYKYGSLFIRVMRKDFGCSLFQNAPREIDYRRAKQWAEKQMDLIRRFTTFTVIEPAAYRPIPVVMSENGLDPID
jgi:hypothetical protein